MLLSSTSLRLQLIRILEAEKVRSPLRPNLSQSAIALLPLYLQKKSIRDKLEIETKQPLMIEAKNL